MEQLRKSWEKLVSYVGRNNGKDIFKELTTMEQNILPLPQYPADGLAKHIESEATRLEALCKDIT
jgi:hypothetical protein